MFDQADNEFEGRFYVFETDRLVVKNLSLIELKGNYPNWMNDDRITRFTHYQNHHISFEDVKNYINSLDGDASQHVWACYCKNTGVHIGNISLRQIDFNNGSAEVECFIGEPNYWQKGYGVELSQLIVAYAFDELGLNRLYGSAPLGHPTARKLAAKLGFTEEGISRQALRINKEFVDVMQFGLLKDDYENTRG